MLKFITGSELGSLLGSLLPNAQAPTSVVSMANSTMQLAQRKNRAGEVVSNLGSIEHRVASESAPDMDSSRDELALPRINAVRL